MGLELGVASQWALDSKLQVYNAQSQSEAAQPWGRRTGLACDQDSEARRIE